MGLRPYILTSCVSLVIGGVLGTLAGFIYARNLNSQSEHFLALEAARRSADSDLTAVRHLREGRVEGAILYLERQLDGSLVEIHRLRRDSSLVLEQIEESLLPRAAEYRMTYPWTKIDSLETQAKSVLEPYMKVVP